MPIGFVFWVIWLIWLIARVFGWRYAWSSYTGYYRQTFIGSEAMLMLLLFLIGWHDFGFPIRYS